MGSTRKRPIKPGQVYQFYIKKDATPQEIEVLQEFSDNGTSVYELVKLYASNKLVSEKKYMDLLDKYNKSLETNNKLLTFLINKTFSNSTDESILNLGNEDNDVIIPEEKIIGISNKKTIKENDKILTEDAIGKVDLTEDAKPNKDNAIISQMKANNSILKNISKQKK